MIDVDQQYRIGEPLMQPIDRYLFGSLGYAAIFYLVGRMLWPADSTAVAAIVQAVLFGLIMQAGVLWRKHRKSEEKEPYSALFFFVSGVLGSVACVVCWAITTPRPGGLDLLGLLGALAFSLYLVVCGFQVRRRSRQATAAPSRSAD